MSETERTRYLRIALALIAVVTLIRVIVLIVSPLNLYPDEAQYWWWAKNPAFGYFSKPPLIGWTVWLTMALFGDSEWAIRIASPLLHAASTLFIFAIARRLFDSRVALWSALAYLTTPGVSYSSGLISTDVPLLFCWSAALYGFVRALDDPRWRWAVLTGVAFGFGLEAKYAMFYFLLCAGFAALVSPKARGVVFSARGAAILAIGLVLLVPNIAWNAGHGFPTVSHTESNADWSHARYSVIGTLAFIGGQFGVFGPVLMLGLLVAFWRTAAGAGRNESNLILAAFCAPPLMLIVIQSFISEANANWAATAYVAATPLAVVGLAAIWRGRLLWLALAFDALVMAMFWAVLASPSFAERIGQGNAFKRLEGWKALGADVAQTASQGHFPVIVAANRSVIAELVYYARPRTAGMRVWDRDLHDDDHYQMTMRLRAPAQRVLLALSPDEDATVRPTFASSTLIHTDAIKIGGRHQRVSELYDARGYNGPQPESLRPRINAR